MKRIILFLLIFFSNLNVLNGQDVVMNPDDVSLDTIFDFLNDPFPQFMSTYDLNSNVFNNGSSDIELQWEIEQLSGPTEWKTLLSYDPASGGHSEWGQLSNFATFPLTIEGEGNSHFNMRVRPNLVAGCGVYRVKITPYSDTTNILTTGIFNLKINVDADCNELVATKNVNRSTAKIFPNPTTDYFSITENPDVKSIQIFDILGKEMAVSSFQNGDAINISNFPNGLYLVRMLDDDGDVLKTTRLTKR